MAVSGKTLYVGADNDLLALRTDTGAVRWHTPIGWVYGGGPAVRDGRVYIAADRAAALPGGHLAEGAEADGATMAAAPSTGINGWPPSCPAVSPDRSTKTA